VRRAAALALALCFAVPPAPARAQADDRDPLLDVADEPAPSAWSLFGDALLRYDRVDQLANRPDGVERVRSRARLGALWSGETLEFGLAVEGALGSDSNDDNVRNNDNEASDDFNLDQAWLRWRFGEDGALLLGKSEFGLVLGSMIWDRDLRPAGATVQESFALGERQRLGVVAGYVLGDLLYGDDSRIGALQAGWFWHEGEPVQGSAVLSYLDFSDLQDLTRSGLARTNRISGGRLVSDYRLLDLNAGISVDLAGRPLRASVDLVRNLGADDLRDAARGELAWGDSRQDGGWELGYAYQRIQRDAAMAAFNSDDWWFHSWVRGFGVWAGYGFGEHWSVRVSGFRERRDGQDQHVERLLLDLMANW